MHSATKRVSVLVADDHPIFRDGLRKLLEAHGGFVVVGEAGDGEQAARLAAELKPDILLLDLAMPGSSGLDALRTLSAGDGSVRAIILSGKVEKGEMLSALQLGARGVILKESSTQLLFKCIGRVMAGEYWVGRDGVTDLVDALRSIKPQSEPPPVPKQLFGLTKRELEVLGTIVGGYTNKEIAKSLTLSEDTVKHHITNIFNKLGVSNRLELALFALHHKVVDIA